MGHRTRRYIGAFLRYLLMVLVPGISLLAVTLSALVDLVYSVAYLPASAPFSVLAVGMGAITVFQVFTNILIAGGKPRTVMLIGAVQVPLSVLLYMILIPVYGLLGAAAAMAIAGILGALMAGIIVVREHGSFMKFKSIMHMVAAAILPVMIALLIPVQGLLLVPWYLMLLGIYVLILHLMGELGADDFRLIKQSI